MRFIDIRKAALISFIASVFAISISAWNATQTMMRIESVNSLSKGLVALGLAVIYPFAAIMPVFYFALYRNEGTLRFTRELRLLSLAAAVSIGIVLAAGLPDWIESQGPYWTAIKTLDWRSGGTSLLPALRALKKINQFSTLLAALGDIAYILLLVALFRQGTSGDSTPDLPVSRWLKLVTTVAIIAWGIWAAFNLLRILSVPFTYAGIRSFDLQTGRTPPSFATVMLSDVRDFVTQASLFAAPFVVFKSIRAAR
jgi:hypothetical protein